MESGVGAPENPLRVVVVGSGPSGFYVTDALVNLSSVKLDGFDLVVKYTWNTPDMGRFDFASNTGIYRSYDFVFFPGDPAFETVGRSTVTNGTIPRWQTYVRRLDQG